MCPWITETVKLSFHFLIIRNLLHLYVSYQKPTFNSSVDSARNWIMVMFMQLFLFWIYYSRPFKISIILYHGSVVRQSGGLPEGGNLMKLFDNLIFLLSCKYFPKAVPLLSWAYLLGYTQVRSLPEWCGSNHIEMAWLFIFYDGLLVKHSSNGPMWVSSLILFTVYILKNIACLESNFQSIKRLFTLSND